MVRTYRDVNICAQMYSMLHWDNETKVCVHQDMRSCTDIQRDVYSHVGSTGPRCAPIKLCRRVRMEMYSSLRSAHIL